jgi:hypothetical protein
MDTKPHYSLSSTRAKSPETTQSEMAAAVEHRGTTQQLSSGELFRVMSGGKRKKYAKAPDTSPKPVEETSKRLHLADSVGAAGMFIPVSSQNSDPMQYVQRDMDSLFSHLSMLPQEQLVAVIGILMGKTSKLLLNSPSSPKKEQRSVARSLYSDS